MGYSPHAIGKVAWSRVKSPDVASCHLPYPSYPILEALHCCRNMSDDIVPICVDPQRFSSTPKRQTNVE